MAELFEAGVIPSSEYFGGLLDHGLQLRIAPRPVEGGTYTYTNDNLFFSPRIGIQGSVRKETIDLLLEKFPGNKYSRKRIEKKRDSWEWIITNNEESLAFLNEVSPLLTVKKAQTLVLKEYLRRRIERGRGQMLPEDRLAEDQGFYERFLNAKKVDDEATPILATPQRLAGITDIGASIGIGKGKGKEHSRNIYFLFFNYTSTEPSLLELFKHRYQIGKVEPLNERVDGKISYGWNVLHSQAETILVDLAPHLVYSQPLAELGIVFQAVQTHLGEEYFQGRFRSEEAAKKSGYKSGKQLRDQIRESYRQRMLNLRYGDLRSPRNLTD